MANALKMVILWVLSLILFSPAENYQVPERIYQAEKD